MNGGDLTLSTLVYTAGKWQSPLALPPLSAAFLVLSGLATGTSWLCYFRALKLGGISLVGAGVVLLSLRS